MPIPPIRRVATALLLATSPLAVAALPAPAHADGACTGTTYHFVSGDDESSDFWAAGNWQPAGVPGAHDSVVLDTLPWGAVSADVETSGTVCSMTFGDSEEGGDLTVVPGATLTVTGSTTVVGGSADNQYTSVLGSITTGSLEVSGGFVYYDTEDAETPALITAGALAIDDDTDFMPGSSLSNVTVNGPVTLGAGAVFDSNSSNGDSTSNAVFTLNGTLSLGGDAASSHLVVDAEPGSTIDLAGHTWTLRGVANSTFADGTTITSSAPGGALVISDGERVELDGTTTVEAPATVHLAQLPDESIGYLSSTSEWSKSGHAGTLTGDGTFLWTNGQVEGLITLDEDLVVDVSGAGYKTVADEHFKPQTRLLTKSAHFTVTGGTLENEGETDTIENAGSITFTGGTFGSNGSSGKPLLNDKGATITFGPATGKKKAFAGWGSSKLTNKGTVVIAPATTLTINNFVQASSGTLQLTIAGTKASQHSTLRAIYARSKFAGTLQLVTADGYAPKPGTTVKGLIASRNGSKGRFKVVSAGAPAKTAWSVSIKGGSVNATLAKAKH